VRRILTWLAVIAVGVSAIAGVGGYALFTRPQGDELSKADAIIVLGGDPDGRVDYGLELARQGYADTVVLSDGYKGAYEAYPRACASRPAGIEVICFLPDPWTTRGEAMFTGRLARERGWNHVIVVSWNFHMVRARFIFEKCFDGQVTMRPVPRTYDYSPTFWAYTYAYQYAALVKAILLPC
jgi:uncharacterized SAM-binding protein YcdF (DUF218 family)